MEVIGRHFVRHLDEDSETDTAAWMLIVKAVDLDDGLFEAIADAFA